MKINILFFMIPFLVNKLSHDLVIYRPIFEMYPQY
jgi:hypothetical protein